MSKEIIVWKVNNGDSAYYESNPGMIAELLTDMTPSESEYYTITCHYMLKNDYDNLPEFTGF